MKILVFGEVCYDIFVYGSSKRLSPEAPVPVFVPEREERNFGMAGNVLQNLKAICDSCDTELFSQPEIIKKTRYVDDKSNHMFLRVDEGEINLTSFVLTSEIENKIKEADIVIVSDYNKGFLDLETIYRIGKLSKLSIIDAKKKLNREILDVFTFIKLNENEFNNNVELVNGFENKLLITLGIKGCQFNGKIYKSPNPQVTMDVSGAGDTFTAAFIFSYCTNSQFTNYLDKTPYESNKLNIEKSIKFANQMASIVVSKRGVKTP